MHCRVGVSTGKAIHVDDDSFLIEASTVTIDNYPRPVVIGNTQVLIL
jgi:hypothetical protein